jgi:two-component system OmpR family response regulator
MACMRILLVEDEARLAEKVARGLREEGHVVDVCGTAADARRQVLDVAYDVVVLDWMLPDVDGPSLLRAWRTEGLRLPVLMLTARGEVGERVTGLRAGADDYLVKPFAFAELVARLEALQRRAVGASVTLTVGGVELDARRHHLCRGELEVSLSPRELSLAHELFTHAGDVMTRSHLLTAVWGWGFEGDPNILDVYVGYLRRKLDALGPEGPRIVAVRGVGFRLSPAEPER